MERKVQAQYSDHGFGFPVTLLDVPMVKVRGCWTPSIDYNALALVVLKSLVRLDGRLTGSQVKFIRLHFEMTLQQFARRLGLTHPAVVKWERRANRPTGMNWTTEKDIRLFVSKRLSGTAKDFYGLYGCLEQVAPMRAVKLSVGAGSSAKRSKFGSAPSEH